MDLTLIAGAAGAIRAALDIGKSAVSVHDAIKLSDVVLAMNEKLLDAQQSLFTHNTQVAELQQQYFEATKELRELKEALAQRQRYTLFEIVPGSFVYRMDIAPKQSGTSEPGATQGECYFCQFCLDDTPSRPVALRFKPADVTTGASWYCVGCKTAIHDPSRPRIAVDFTPHRGDWRG